MFIVLLTEKFVQIIYFVIKTDNTFISFTFFEKYRKRKNENNLEIIDSKYFMFGKYRALSSIERGFLAHSHFFVRALWYIFCEFASHFFVRAL